MKIEPIKVEHIPHHLRMLRCERCCELVRISPTRTYPTGLQPCKRIAMYRVDGVAYCTQHAGNRALNHIMELDAEYDALQEPLANEV